MARFHSVSKNSEQISEHKVYRCRSRSIMGTLLFPNWTCINILRKRRLGCYTTVWLFSASPCKAVVHRLILKSSDNSRHNTSLSLSLYIDISMYIYIYVCIYIAMRIHIYLLVLWLTLRESSRRNEIGRWSYISTDAAARLKDQDPNNNNNNVIYATYNRSMFPF